MSSANAEDTSLVSDHGATELGDAEGVTKGYLVRNHLLDVEEVDRLAAPLEVVNKLVRRVALLQNKSVVKKLSKLFNDINIRVVSNSAAEFSELTHFEDQVFLNLVEL